MNIIFLDVDGVLNSMAYFKSLGLKNTRQEYDDISDFHLKMLAEIYHACDAKIVLSSTWRQLGNKSSENVHPQYQYLIDCLSKYDMEIISETPIINMNRPLEILTWINRREDKQDIRFVSLDDDFSEKHYENYGIGECLVKTRFFCEKISEGGLQKEHVEKAISILNGDR